MRAVKIATRCLLGCALGFAPGLVLFFLGYPELGLGLAVIGGVLGILLAVVGVVYKTNAFEAFSRGFLLFLRFTAQKNLPGGEHLVPIKEKEIPLSIPATQANPVALDDRTYLGMKVGMAIATIPAILIVIYLPRDTGPDADPLAIEILVRATLALSVVTFVGGVYGGAVAALTIPGVHRRNILLGSVVGLIIGTGVAIAITPGAASHSWVMYCFGCGLFNWLGTVSGMLASENFRSQVFKSNSDEEEGPGG